MRYNEVMLKNRFINIRQAFKDHPELWFFVFANFVFVVMFIWSILINPDLLKPATFAIFTLLTLIHIVVHWSLLLIGEDERWFWPYVIFQGGLAFAIILMSNNVGMIFALYMALIGEMIGSQRRRVKTVMAVLFFLALSLTSQLIIEGPQSSLWWLLGTIMSMIFVVLYVSVYSQEVSARSRAQKLLNELEIAHRQLSEYADQVEDLTLTTERQRMARELHDTLAQGLAGLILQLEAADSHLSANHAPQAQAIIQQAMLRARTTLTDARQAIGDLRAAPTTPADLAAAILAETERFTDTIGIRVQLGLCEPKFIPPQIAENIHRAISEGLMNIAKHAQATTVVLTMTCAQDNLLVELFDNGIGFDPETAIGKSGHYGLLGMRERARILGGSLAIESLPAPGTTLKIELPLRAE
jgi:two-component system, NarL family, sensor histidine kinase YdfH